MRILHAPVEIAGQVALSAHGLREIGQDAHAYFPPHHFGYALAPDVAPFGSNRWLRALSGVEFLLRSASEYDVFHFHFGSSFLPTALGYPDARWLQARGRTVVVEFWGSDARLPRVEAARNPYYVNAYQESDAANERRLRRWADITDGHVVIADNSFDAFLEPYFPHIHVVRQRVDTRRLTPSFPDPEARVPVVVHAPSRAAAKGTKYVRAAVERLKAKGARFEYRELSGIPNAEVMRACEEADLIVDQLCAGSHGVFAAEAMSLGKPVLCHILPELLPTYPEGFPIIDANPETVESVLAEWLERPQDRHLRGVQARSYAERVHDCRAVAERLLDVYREVART